MGDWVRTDRDLPPNGTEVETISPSGQEGRLIYDSNLWWLPDRSMYVYYAPEFWRPVDA